MIAPAGSISEGARRHESRDFKQMFPRPHTSHHLDALTGVRAAAALWVLIYHVWLLSGAGTAAMPFFRGVDLSPLLAMGYLGVDVFFVLSGFVLSLQVLRSVSKQQMPYSTFLRRRILRVYPAYYACLTILLLVSLWGTHPHSLGVTDVALHAVMFHNLVDENVSSINPVFWSMPFEWQFYLLFPYLVLALLRQRPFLLLGVCMGIAVVTKLLVLAGGPEGWTHVLLAQLPFRIDEFVVGMIGANIAGAISPRASLRRCIFWIGSLALGGAVIYYGIAAPLWWTWNLDAVIRSLWVEVAVVAILIGLSGDTHLGVRLFANSVLVWLGTISYSIYLWHFPLLLWLRSTTLVRQRGVAFDEMFTSLLTIGLALVLVFSAISYYTVERPFHNAARENAVYSEIRIGAAHIDGFKLLMLWGGCIIILAVVFAVAARITIKPGA